MSRSITSGWNDRRKIGLNWCNNAHLPHTEILFGLSGKVFIPLHRSGIQKWREMKGDDDFVLKSGNRMAHIHTCVLNIAFPKNINNVGAGSVKCRYQTDLIFSR